MGFKTENFLSWSSGHAVDQGGVVLEIMSSGTYGSVMTIGEGAQQLFPLFGAEPAVATSGWKQRAALGLLMGEM